MEGDEDSLSLRKTRFPLMAAEEVGETQNLSHVCVFLLQKNTKKSLVSILYTPFQARACEITILRAGGCDDSMVLELKRIRMHNLAVSSETASVWPVDRWCRRRYTREAESANSGGLTSGKVYNMRIPRATSLVSQCRKAISVTRSDITVSQCQMLFLLPLHGSEGKYTRPGCVTCLQSS